MEFSNPVLAKCPRRSFGPSTNVPSPLISIFRLFTHSLISCGHSFLPSNMSDRAQRNLAPPPRLAFLAVVGVDLCCAVLACVTVKLFLNPLQKQTSTKAQDQEEQPAKFSAPIFRLTLKNLRRPKPDLLIPLTIFNGLEQAFAVGLYTKVGI